MDFVRYAERAANLVNTPLTALDDLASFLREPESLGDPGGPTTTDGPSDRAWLVDSLVGRDLQQLRRFQRDLRPVFESGTDGDDATVIGMLNALLDKHPVTPYIAGDGQAQPGRTPGWHMHVSNKSSSVSELLIAEALMGLAFLACDLGPQRLGLCQASGCEAVFVDTSPNQSRRYCSDRCSSRANVAAYRARQKAGAGAGVA